MRKILIAALALAIASPALAEGNRNGPANNPCVVKQMTKDSPEYKRLVRDMRRQGYRIETTNVATGAKKQISVGGEAKPVALRHANVAVDGC